MNEQELIQQLQNSQARLTTFFLSVSKDQDWQPNPEAWSFRYLAAHLAAAEEECFLDRVMRIANGNRPQFDYYLNTGRDFSRTDLRNSLQVWAWARQALINFVLALPQEKLSLTGQHATFGEITILDTLKIMLEHDLEHLTELQQLIGLYRQSSLIARCRQEVIELHQFFQDWLNGNLPFGAETFARLTDVLNNDFVIIGPDGSQTTQASLVAGLRSNYQACQNMKIWIQNFRTLHRSDKILIATYHELQTNLDDPTPITTTRISTVVFGEKTGTPNGVEWLHVHETWLET